jgi:predicted TIM-barrel fold metal-dependent hydrolase
VIVDVHSHYYPVWYLRRLAERTVAPLVRCGDGGPEFVFFADEERRGRGRPFDADALGVERTLAFMDESGIDVTVLSPGNPWAAPFSPAESTACARGLNEETLAAAHAHPGRILGFGVLPHSDVRTILAEIAWLADRSEFVGVVLGSRLGGLALDHERLRPVWAALSAAELVAFIHPHDGIGTGELDGWGSFLPVGVGFPVETSLAVARLVLAGRLTEHPVRLLVPHAGGVLPLLARRLDRFWESDAGLRAQLSSPPSLHVAQMYVDSIAGDSVALDCLRRLHPLERIVFGTDHPFTSNAAAQIAEVPRLFGDGDADAVLGANACRLFPGLEGISVR